MIPQNEIGKLGFGETGFGEMKMNHKPHQCQLPVGSARKLYTIEINSYNNESAVNSYSYSYN